MQEYNFHTWRKVKIWKKDQYTIKANSEKEAIEKAKKLFQSDEIYPGYDDGSCEWYDGNYSEDDEVLTYWDEEAPTYELWFGDLEDVIDNNEPLEIKRDKKLSGLLK